MKYKAHDVFKPENLPDNTVGKGKNIHNDKYKEHDIFLKDQNTGVNLII